ncbi:MAG: hypothetical protein K5694_00255 [Bacilli bacterium]|nr:hypothetical protein [Bacilli bacterium]
MKKVWLIPIIGGGLIITAGAVFGIIAISNYNNNKSAEEEQKSIIQELSSETKGSEEQSIYEDSLDKKYQAEMAKPVEERDFTTVFASYEMANYSYTLLSRHSSWKTSCSGYTDPGALGKQNITSSQIYDGNVYFEEMNNTGVTISTYNTYSRHYESGSMVNTYIKRAKDDYSDSEKTQRTIEDYVKVYGRAVSNPLTYIISESTVMASDAKSPDGPTKMEKVSEGYIVDVETRAQKAAVNQVIRMNGVSGVSSAKYEYCHLKITLDDALGIKSCYIHERYTAYMSGGLISATLNSELTTTYEVDGTYEIPAEPSIN